MQFEPVEATIEPRGRSGERKRVLVCVPFYLPASGAGGPTRAVANQVSHLSPYYDFYVVTRDRDTTDTETYTGITPGHWYRVGNALVLYCSSVAPGILRRAYREVQPDVICLNSFQYPFTRVMVLLRWLGLLGKTPTLLAPHGEFSPGAMKIKAVKKLLYRHGAKLLGFHESLHWHATGAPEKLDILRAAPARRLDPDSVHVAQNISDAARATGPHVEKIAGEVKLAWIARISQMKNLDFLLEILREIRGRVELDIHGMISACDTVYSGRCKALLATMPENVTARYHGPLDHSAVPQTLLDHHFFVLPTSGENYCFAAVESLVNGTPVILSDRTPWTNLGEARAGFDIPVDDRRAWINALQACIDMDQATYKTYLDGAREYSRRFSIEAAIKEHLDMFEAVLIADRKMSPSTLA